MKRRRPVIAIDGPVGAGKSTIARQLARALGFVYLNTGAMYRAVAIAARQAGLKPEDAENGDQLKELLARVRIEFNGERITLDGTDISDQISTPEVSDLASKFSALKTVRERMRYLQRAAGEEGGVVMEGRDIGTVIFPDAEVKFFLEADVNERAERRFKELHATGDSITREEVLRQLIERDARDRAREFAPLKRADDALAIDSTKLTVDEVVAVMKKHMEQRINSGKALKRA
jgi:CMP/dCMP kinase